jgi:peptidoglycan/xylan/chitin deacetylase (PgdA/CDA1 family)
VTSDWVNLCFHGIGWPGRELEPGESAYWIGQEFFLRVLDHVHRRGHVSVSFDDGNASDVEIAAPALSERELEATFFPVAGRLDTPGSLASTDLADLHDQGFGIGSHGMHHRAWRGLSSAEEESEMELARQHIAAAAGAPVTTVAVPFGEYDAATLRSLHRHGYERVFTSDRARPRPEAWLQPRYSIREIDDLDSVRALLARRPGFASATVDRARITSKSWRW